MDIPTLTAASRELEDGRIELLAPSVGLWRGAPRQGAVIRAGGSLGELEILGVLHRLIAPAGGVAVGGPEGPARARRPVVHGERLLLLDPEAAASLGAGAAAEKAARESGTGLAFVAPSSGRFYSRPAPDRPPFVSPGDEVEIGKTVCLIEVMKTFNRVAYGGEGMPPKARVVRVVPGEGDDVDTGAPLIELEPIG